MTDKPPSRQVVRIGEPKPPAPSQAKTFKFNFMTAKIEPSKAGRPPKNPISKKEGQAIIRFRSDNQKQQEGKPSMYLNTTNENLLRGFGAKIDAKVYGKVAKQRYESLVAELMNTKHPEDQTRAVEKIIELINIVDENKNLPDSELGTQITRSLIGFERQRQESRRQEDMAKTQPLAPLQTELETPAQTPAQTPMGGGRPLLPQGRQGKKPTRGFSDIEPVATPNQTYIDMMNAQTGNQPSTSSSMRDNVVPSAPSDAYIKAGEDKTRAIIEKSKSRSRPSSRDVSMARESNIGTDNPKEMSDWDSRDEEPAPAVGGGSAVSFYLKQSAKNLDRVRKQKQGSTDPTDMTKFQDAGGATNYTFDEHLGGRQPTPSQPDAVNYGTGLSADNQSNAAMDFEKIFGKNSPFGISMAEEKKQEEKEQSADMEALGYYARQQSLLDRNPAITQGGGNDVTGRGKGSQKDVILLGSDYAPASYDVYNPQSMKRSVSTRGNSIGVTLSGMPLDDNDVRRNVRNAGLSNEGLTPEEILERDMYAEIISGERAEGGGRLADRVGQAMMDNAVSMGSAGSGIAGQIGSLIDQQRDGAGQDRSREGLVGGEDSWWGGGGFGDGGLTNPRTLNERFSNLGLRRQGDKIDKYVNMKNKGMMYSNLMGKGVSDPSIQSIRDRKDDYIQPNGKHKGNSVNLIRQSNATSIRLNNMYMP